jgi:hypothetical protein
LHSRPHFADLDAVAFPIEINDLPAVSTRRLPMFVADLLMLLTAVTTDRFLVECVLR